MYYKLTDEKGETFGHTVWEVGVTHKAVGKGHQFCSPALIHFYSDPLLAVLLNPIHAGFANPRLWEVEAFGKVYSDYGLKLGAKRVTVVRELSVPVITSEVWVRFGILCSLEVYREEGFLQWAGRWLSGEDRTAAAVRAATARAAARAATARAAVRAAGAAAGAAATAAGAAATATAAAVRAAAATARAAGAAAHVTRELDLIGLARQALEEAEKYIPSDPNQIED